MRTASIMSQYGRKGKKMIKEIENIVKTTKKKDGDNAGVVKVVNFLMEYE